MIAHFCAKFNKKYLDKLRKCDYTVSNLKRYGGDNVIKTYELRGVIAKNGYSQSDIAKMIGVTPKTFYEKMKAGVFGSDEIQIMIDNLKIEDAMAIFFAQE